jgi:methylenetetrahydrofolate dehydrogenase (NADP+)/methenyltetrahydrofolate cyclohydrolase
MILLDGKTTSQKLLDSLKQEIQTKNLKPMLDIILVGDYQPSIKYVEMKQKKAESIGINGQIHHLPESSTTSEIISLIQKLNQDDHVTGLMVQLPLPPQIDTLAVLSAINPKKDADGLNPTNLGLLFQKKSTGILSATSLGIMKLLEEYKIDLNGKNAVIIGRSPDVSLPLFACLMAKNATVTICHSHTQNLSQITSQADILISAIGKPKFLKSEYVKKNAVVIDVGYAIDPTTGKSTGDFDFDAIKDKVSYITPVPGGVGPMTVASLLFNTVQLAKIEYPESKK